VRILGIESSSRRGSVALLDGQALILSLEHEQVNSHAELLLPMIDRLLGEAGWHKSSLDRLGVGTGPGSFTGLRAGIALAEGLSVGLELPLVGVGSLRAMAYGACDGDPAPLCALLDALRGELFAAVYSGPQELSAPVVLAIADLTEYLNRNPVAAVVGEVARQFAHGRAQVSGKTVDLPHARWVAALAGQLEEADCPPLPHYLRGIGATLPQLPVSHVDPNCA
jgi:tRNA threonylcarbamoyladenosine biosynthesis protein TsaB